jgi:molybdopterin-guanine dinucleotide biosynthesis protein A
VNPAPAFRAVEDAPPAGRGPLGGLLAAYAVTGTADLLVLACDYPAVTTELLQEVLRAAGPEDDLVLLTDGRGRDHPLVGLWRRSVQPEVEAALGGRIYKVRALLAGVRARRLHPRDLPQFDLDQALRNVNEPADLA